MTELDLFELIELFNENDDVDLNINQIPEMYDDEEFSDREETIIKYVHTIYYR